MKLRHLQALAGLGEALAGAARDSAQSVRVQAAWGLANLADTLRLAAAAAAGGPDAHAASSGAALLACLPVLCTGEPSYMCACAARTQFGNSTSHDVVQCRGSLCKRLHKYQWHPWSSAAQGRKKSIALQPSHGPDVVVMP